MARVVAILLSIESIVIGGALFEELMISE